MKLRVLLVAPKPPPVGGIGNRTLAILAEASKRSDIDIRVVDTSPRWRDVTDLSVLKRLFGGGLQSVRDMVRMLAIIRRWRPDVIHLSTSGSLAVMRDWLCSRLARAARIPIVLFIHFGRIPAIALANTWEWRVFLSAVRRSTRVVVLDKPSERILHAMGIGAKTVVIPHGISLDSLPEKLISRPNCHTVLFVGWVIPTKGVGELIDAWQEVECPGWKLRLVGPVSESYSDEIRLRAGARCETIQILGELPHDKALQEIANCDIFVLPSYTEGFPNVILEAMALERPIVATSVGAIPEMLAADSPTPCGIVVEPKQVDSLAAALRTLMGDSTQRDQLGMRARCRVKQKYMIMSWIDQLVELWEQAVAETNNGME